MTGSAFAIAIELIVAGLLATTIGYCVVLNRRLTRLHADESAFKATILELVTATDSAERAIAGLQTTVKSCDGHLGDRIRTAERFTAELDKQLRNGRDVIDRIAQITEAARSVAGAAPPARGEPAAGVPRLDAARLQDGLAAAGVAAFRAAAEQAPARTGATVKAAQALAERARRRAAG